MKLNVSVTESHIFNGKQGSLCFCPIALSLKEMTNRVWEVDGEVQLINHDPIRLPWQACVFINDFDAGRKVEPFAFELDLPEGYLA